MLPSMKNAEAVVVFLNGFNHALVGSLEFSDENSVGREQLNSCVKVIRRLITLCVIR